METRNEDRTDDRKCVNGLSDAEGRYGRLRTVPATPGTLGRIELPQDGD